MKFESPFALQSDEVRGYWCRDQDPTVSSSSDCTLDSPDRMPELTFVDSTTRSADIIPCHCPIHEGEEFTVPTEERTLHSIQHPAYPNLYMYLATLPWAGRRWRIVAIPLFDLWTVVESLN